MQLTSVGYERFLFRIRPSNCTRQPERLAAVISLTTTILYKIVNTTICREPPACITLNMKVPYVLVL